MPVVVTTSAGGHLKTATGTPQEVLDYLSASAAARISRGKIIEVGFTSATACWAMHEV